MANKKVNAIRNAATGSYTIAVPKSSRTGNFEAVSPRRGRIVVVTKAKKSA